MNRKEVVVGKKTAIGKIVKFNVITVMFAQNQECDDNIKVQIGQNSTQFGAVHNRAMELLDKTDFSELQDYSLEGQQKTRSFITEYADICIMHEIDLGKASLLKQE